MCRRLYYHTTWPARLQQFYIARKIKVRQSGVCVGHMFCQLIIKPKQQVHCLLLLRAYVCYLLKIAMVCLLSHSIKQILKEVKYFLEEIADRVQKTAAVVVAVVATVARLFRLR